MLYKDRGYHSVITSDDLKGAAIVNDDDGLPRESGPARPQRHSRRLSDKVLVAFHHACDTQDLETATELLQTLENMLTRRPSSPDGNRRRNMESLIAAHERLWHLRHPANNDL